MPAPTNPLKAALAKGTPQIGLWMAFAHPTVAEIGASAGFDWCLIDAEHSPNDIPLILSQLQAMAGGRASAAVRVPVGDVRIVKQVLDLGVQNVLVPMVNTADDAAQMVRAVRYPPHGVRGVGAAQSRATQYGAVTDYVHDAGDQICLMVQAETQTAIDNIDAIAGTDGVDCVFLGPADLAASMGHLGNPGHPDVVAAIAHAASRIKAAGKAVGMITFDVAQVASLKAKGGTFIAVGGDIATFAKAVRKLALDARQAIAD